MSKSLRIIFAGTTGFSSYFLNAIINKSCHKVVGVLTRSDKPSGRGKLIKCSEVKKVAVEKKIPIFQPDISFTEEDCKNIQILDSDLLISVSYGLIIPDRLLTIPKFGCINVHPSLLPRWRGSSPIQRTLLSGDKKSGITIIQMDKNIDSGDILYQESCSISTTDTSMSLYNKLSYIGCNAMLFLLNEIAYGNKIVKKSQNSKFATYAKKIQKHEARLNWNLPAVVLDRCVRAFNPWPVSFFFLRSGMIVKVWSAFFEKASQCDHDFFPGTILRSNRFGISVSTAEGNLVLKTLQFPGKKEISVSEILNSKKNWFEPGTKLI